MAQSYQDRPFASINGTDVKEIAKESPYLMVEVDADDGSLVGVPSTNDLTTYYTAQGIRYDKQSDGNWKDQDGHLWCRDDSGNFNIVSRNPNTVTVGQTFADRYNSISDWFSKPITVAGDEDTLGGYDTMYTTTPSEQIQIASVPFIWSKPAQAFTALGGAYAGGVLGGTIGEVMAYSNSNDPSVQKASERAGEFIGSLVGGGITASKLYPKQIPEGPIRYQERPSKLTEKELLGIPKGERNQPLNSHLKGDDAVTMFKEYGSDAVVPEGSINYSTLLKYAPEARERYGIVGRKDISDAEIARALYKRVKSLGKDSAALNEAGEPQLLFRGDTRNYTKLKHRLTPMQVANKSETMDNSLGTLFLGEFPGTLSDRYDAVGASRYLAGEAFNPITGV